MNIHVVIVAAIRCDDSNFYLQSSVEEKSNHCVTKEEKENKPRMIVAWPSRAGLPTPKYNHGTTTTTIKLRKSRGTTASSSSRKKRKTDYGTNTTTSKAI